MPNQKITAAVVGLGSRGNAYAECCKRLPDSIEIVACADILPDKLARFAKEYNIAPEMQFNSAEELLQRERLADVLFICTMDQQHYGHAIPALKLGYHLLLEKPASPNPAECAEIARVAGEMNRQVVVCHVLRYTGFYQTLKSLLDEETIGQVYAVEAREPVVYWHQAHSFVRGNWRNSDSSSPMILQKCCHDMDILLWLTGKHCKTVSSFGSLSHFKAENAPAGAPERCSEACPEYFRCPYSIKHCYLDHAERGEFGWPINVVEAEPDIEKLRETLKTSPYGRCVYHCDNNVVDHQVVNLLLEDDLTITFNMCAFTYGGGREIRLMGTKGEIVAKMDGNLIEVHPFAADAYNVPVARNDADEFGHGGGDMGIVEDLIGVFSGSGKKSLTSIDNSIESHLVALAAEKSRAEGGRAIDMQEYTKSL